MTIHKISDEAVLKATGKNWLEWFALLDKAGAQKMKHIDIARMLSEKYLGKSGAVNVATNSGWWAQMVTVEYERARGLRKINEQADGFSVSVHKTFPCSVTSLQKKWEQVFTSPVITKKNLVRIPSKTKRAMLRYNADIGKVIVSFDERGEEKSRIMIEAIRLQKQSLVETERAFWKEVLNLL
jgi:hypothetical protein